jgi:hypothetical protein
MVLSVFGRFGRSGRLANRIGQQIGSVGKSDQSSKVDSRRLGNGAQSVVTQRGAVKYNGILYGMADLDETLEDEPDDDDRKWNKCNLRKILFV